jgi:predicted nucleic acid-binding Zn ribbon protein
MEFTIKHCTLVFFLIMINNAPQKICKACSKMLVGRTDKKFCNDYCRNNFNNQQRAETSNYARNIIHTLKRNKRILEDFLGEAETFKTTKEKLLNQGFQFKYFTHHYKTNKGNVYVFCFEYGYLGLENDWYLIVKKEEA